MKASELRIGNILCVLIPACPVVIEEKRFALIMEGDDTYYPLPLTEDWLLKLGFKKDKNAFLKREFIYDLKGGHFYIDRIGYEIEYVHQLQNLYYALTGEELTISPE